jgi:dipeptidyl aminopeptidase/acylaminoacyl peptidase
MKSKFAIFLFVLVLLLSSCGPSPEVQATQTSDAATGIASSWTKTPTSTPIPTATSTPTVAPTPLGGGDRILFGTMVWENQTATGFDIHLVNIGVTNIEIDGTGDTIIAKDRQLLYVTPQGDRLIAKKDTDLYIIHINGSGEILIPDRELVGVSLYSHEFMSVSPGGDRMLVYNGMSLYTIGLDGSNEVLLTDKLGTAFWHAKWLDDDYVVYIANETGERTFFISKYDGTEKRQILPPGSFPEPWISFWFEEGRIYWYKGKGNTIQSTWSANLDGTDIKIGGMNFTGLGDSGIIFSPDNIHVASKSSYPAETLIVSDADGSNLVEVWHGTAEASDGIGGIFWSPDGNVLLAEVRTCPNKVPCRTWQYVVFSLSTNDVKIFPENKDGGEYYFADWSPDGRQILLLKYFNEDRALPPELIIFSVGDISTRRISIIKPENTYILQSQVYYIP